MTVGLDPRTPVLVGAAAVEQRASDPESAREPVALLVAALERAAEDAGAGALLARADSILVPRGFWAYPDPGRIIAGAIGATAARTELAELGVLQTTLLGEAARAIRAGEAEVVLVTGGEARDRERVFARAGRAPSYAAQPPGAAPDRLLAPHGDILHPLEIERGIAMPVQQYAMIENALRARDGVSLAAHRREIAELWASMSAVAAANPHAWSRHPLSPDEIATPSAANRLLAFPYAKLHNSQWNVDQAAGLILSSVAAARRAGVPEDRWIFPLAVVDSNHMLPLSERAELAASPGFRLATRRALEAARLDLADVPLIELYSCFPVAVRLQMRELGLAADRPVTVTGGMAFAGGPLNNFVLQAMARVVERLRDGGGETALVTAVSGMLTKQGVSLWGRRPPAAAFRFDDVGADVARATARVPLEPAYRGTARVATYTVLYEGEEPRRAVLLCDTPSGTRALAVVDSAAEARAFASEEVIGRTVTVP
jgi:acetyl-CoA C-acetyltransferase